MNASASSDEDLKIVRRAIRMLDEEAKRILEEHAQPEPAYAWYAAAALMLLLMLLVVKCMARRRPRRRYRDV